MKENKALESLIRYQDLLGELGFTIARDGSYYKDYGLRDGGQARIVPIFDKGMSLDTTYHLSAISVSNEIVIPIEQGGVIPLEYVPRECMEDVTRMIASMAPQSRMPLHENFILVDICTLCGDEVSSFLRQGGETLCLSCFG